MRRLTVKALFAATLLAAAVPAAPASADTATSGYIVLLKDGVGVSSVTNLLGVTVDNVYESAVRGYSGRMTAATAARLARDPRVALVQPDGVASIAAQTLPTGIDRI